ncbi:hypothetical protein P7H22_26700 [Paenibacillus larvae]|nr:hypothetical protein [Paenibacillus larvae]MDT2243195.1 hypothetical protein [Paenibacillus larvae]
MISIAFLEDPLLRKPAKDGDGCKPNLSPLKEISKPYLALVVARAAKVPVELIQNLPAKDFQQSYTEGAEFFANLGLAENTGKTVRIMVLSLARYWDFHGVFLCLPINDLYYWIKDVQELLDKEGR